MVKTKRLFSFVSALVLTFSALAVWAPQKALAATRTWDGGGDGVHWSDGENWSSDTAPVNGDVIVFDVSILSSNETLENDIENLSLAGITRSGTSASSRSYTISGNDITLTGPLTGATSGQNGQLRLEIGITFGANVTFTNTNEIFLDGIDKKTNIGSYNITLNEMAGISFYNLSGSGNIHIDIEPDRYVELHGVQDGYSGDITVTSGVLNLQPSALGSASSITISEAGCLNVGFSGDLLASLTVGGDECTESKISINGYGMSDPVHFKGGLTLTSDIEMHAVVDTYIHNPYEANGHTISLSNTSVGKLVLPDGDEMEVEAKTITITSDDKQPSKSEKIGNNQTYIIDGERGTVIVGTGGTLKGTGTVNSLLVYEGGVLAPGHSPGKLTVLTNLDFSGGATYEVELKNNNEYDKVVVGDVSHGDVILNNATLKGIISDGFKINANDTFTIIENKYSSPVQGTFKDLPEGATFKISDGVFKITYVGGDGNDVVLSVVTVPKTPSSGFMLIFSSPYAILAATVAVAGAAFYLSRRFVTARAK